MINFCTPEEVHNTLNQGEYIFLPNCDSALIGIAEVTRGEEQIKVCCYDYDLLIDCFANNDFKNEDDPIDEATYWVDFNIVGAHYGKYTPLLVFKKEEEYVIM